MLRPLSTMRLLLRTRLEATFRRTGRHWPDSALRLLFRFPLRLVPMRRLATELAAARGALDVGFVVTVSPKGRLDLRVRKDGKKVEAKSTAKPLEIEASAEVEVAIGDVATVRVRGGRREAQEKAQALEDSWARDVEPHLVAAGVTDLDGLDAKIAEARELDAGIKVEGCRTGVAAQPDRRTRRCGGGLARSVRPGQRTCRASLGDVGLDSLAADLKALGADPAAGLRKRRQQLSKEAEAARAVANQAANDPHACRRAYQAIAAGSWMRPSLRGI